ncbi:hypothetical protein DND132_2772 [Pseudodesulfovibrio mercurii]|uniref:DUF4197 domain-containing protein n=1 Tax=Pseudodesulfovibrio mercurii TaxID=641491 RepID=F0JJ76_9BACT|nr:DUF4197 domain-containing protein [Pseudodesulfovibrio mercurii]EGB15975.1 hypothetical protein DND132_2772 [Pseudodesulfovibrio mercurii]
MSVKYNAAPLLTLLLVLSCLLTAAPASAGWGDALKAAGDAGAKAAGLSVTPSQIETAFRELLSMGADSAVESLSQDGGFSKLAATSLSLPDSYQKVAETVAPNLLANLNSAAEAAVPAVGELFQKTIKSMEFANPTGLLSGKSDAVTSYFEESARSDLAKNAAPLIQAALEKAGAGSAVSAVQQLSSLTGTAFDPVDYLTDKTLDSMFLYMAQTEKGVRSGDITATSELLQKVF